MHSAHACPPVHEKPNIRFAYCDQASRSEEAHDTYTSSDMLYNSVLGDIRAFDNKATSKTRSITGEDVKEAAMPERASLCCGLDVTNGVSLS